MECVIFGKVNKQKYYKLYTTYAIATTDHHTRSGTILVFFLVWICAHIICFC